MAKALEKQSESATIVEMLRKRLKRLPHTEHLLCLDSARKPLQLFDEGAVQIRILDPIFYEEGDRSSRGMEMSETKQLQRKLNQERRAAARQLARDASVVQQLEHQKQEWLDVLHEAA